MTLAVIAIISGLLLLVWSADRFVDGAAATASHIGMPPLLIGMMIVGFGTSAPEMTVSALAAFEGKPGIALGNAYGSNICNIALILGLTALLHPVNVHSRVLRKELPILTLVSLCAATQLLDGVITRADAAVLLLGFVALIAWSIRVALSNRSDALAQEIQTELVTHAMPLRQALFWSLVGLVLLIISSRLLVWGAIEVARGIGISDLIIGLTVVAVGTSLPELASSLTAARKGEHDIALGNILGSNLFNTLVVVGLAGMIKPMPVPEGMLWRDVLLMVILTASLFVLAYGFRGPARLARLEGAVLLSVYVGYTVILAMDSATA